jgi:tetratricopeptide (TPR) repeat protein
MSTGREPRICDTCGATHREARCPDCTSLRLTSIVHRETAVLVVVGVVAVLVFVVTRQVAAFHHEWRRRDAAAWYRLGQQALSAGDAPAAVRMLRQATAIDVQNRLFRLTLARALEESGDLRTTRQVLLDLRSLTPEDPDINARLARVAARAGDPDEAQRFYQNALYGVWRADDLQSRQTLRLELVDYLIGQGRRDQALAELLALEGQTAADAGSQSRAADLFLAAGDPRRALSHYEAALARQRSDAHARSGAGLAAFRLGEFERASRYLETAVPDDPDVAEARALASLVVTRDPLAPRLSFTERARRLELAVADARGRLHRCPSGWDRSSSMQEDLDAFSRRLRRPAGQSHEIIERGMDLMARVERETTPDCGAVTQIDRALTLIAARHEEQPR